MDIAITSCHIHSTSREYHHRKLYSKVIYQYFIPVSDYPIITQDGDNSNYYYGGKIICNYSGL